MSHYLVITIEYQNEKSSIAVTRTAKDFGDNGYVSATARKLVGEALSAFEAATLNRPEP